MSLQNVNSQVRPNDCGVPQGSILGPLLFLLRINDLPDTVQSTPILFADDTCLHLHGSKPELLQIKLNREISLAQEWCHANTLTINPQKCHMLFISPKTNDCIQEFAVSLSDTLISTERSAKYLGVIIDTNLNFSDHIKALELKISRAVGILYKLKFVPPSKSFVTLYCTFIHSHLLYGLVVWGSTFPTYLNRLAALQNKAIRVIGGCNYNDRVTPLYLKFEVLKLAELYKLEVAKLVYDLSTIK